MLSQDEMAIKDSRKEQQMDKLKLKIANGHESYVSIVFLKIGDIPNVDSNLCNFIVKLISWGNQKMMSHLNRLWTKLVV